MYYDPTYILYAIPIFIISIICQIWINSSYARNAAKSPGTNLTGKDAAEIIRSKNNFPVDIIVQGKALSDHFDPSKDTVSISTEALKSSVADIAVVAHEFGHVQQKFSNSILFKFRNGLVPIVNIGSNLGLIFIIVGLTIELLNLAQLGLILFSLTTVFAFITIPIERDATRRGLNFIKEYNLIDKDEISGAKSVLNAASMTYVASLLSSLMNLFYYASRVRSRD
jgi:hypothetical protein